MSALLIRHGILLAVVAVLISSPKGRAQSPVPDNAALEEIASGLNFTEGPVWRSDGVLLFSDIPANTIYSWTPGQEGVLPFLQPSGNSNGLLNGPDGSLLLAQHGARQIAVLTSNKEQIPLATHWRENRLNSPNDLVSGSDGSIYFTDPPYGIQESQEEIGFYGIYRIDPDTVLHLLDSTLFRPNGIVLSPDESKLYVDDTPSRTIYTWDLQQDFTLANKRTFAVMNVAGNGADGMVGDADGNLYVSGPGGLWIYAPDGTLLDQIDVPGQTTNVTIGGPDNSTLFITSGSSVYKIEMGITTAVEGMDQVVAPDTPRLLANYPNPFNPETTIRYELSEPGYVGIAVYNLKGRLVASLVSGQQTAGPHQVTWNGRNTSGSQVGSGIYFYRLRTENFEKTRRMLLIR